MVNGGYTIEWGTLALVNAGLRRAKIDLIVVLDKK